MPNKLVVVQHNVNHPSFSKWAAHHAGDAQDHCQRLKSVRAIMSSQCVKNLPGVIGLFCIREEDKDSFLPGYMSLDFAPSTDVDVKTYEVDLDLGYGGGIAMKRSSMMICELTLQIPYEEWKQVFMETHKQLYVNVSKAFVCPTGEKSVFLCVLFDRERLQEVQRQHDVTKPSIFRQFVDDGIVKQIDHIDWHSQVPIAFDYYNKSGPTQSLRILGKVNDPLLAKMVAACEFLKLHQETFSYSQESLIESEFLVQVADMVQNFEGKARDHLRMHAGGPLVLCNGGYVGSIREFEKWAFDMYEYQDKTPDSLYAGRARKSLAAYMQSRSTDCDFVFLDVAFRDGEVAKEVKPRIIIELYKNIAPKAVENFKSMCENAYRGSKFHRVVTRGWIQGGAVGNESIFGGSFEDESFAVKHRGAGDLGMSNTGPHSNVCQFYISLERLSWLDGKNVVFGRVVDGLKAVKFVGKAEIQPWNQKPVVDHFIADCGPFRDSQSLSKKPLQVQQEGSQASKAAPEEGGVGGVREDKGRVEESSGAGGEGQGDAPAQDQQISDMNSSYDEAMHQAALKLQTAGRGFLDRSRVKKELILNFSDVFENVSTDQLWSIFGDFLGSVLQEAGVYKEVRADEKVSLGCKRVVIPMKGWWTDVEREETLVSLNPSKRWISVSVTGPKETLASTKYYDCVLTWKVKEEEGKAKLLFVAKMIPRNEYTAEDISPSFNAEFTSSVEKVKEHLSKS